MKKVVENEPIKEQYILIPHDGKKKDFEEH